MSQPPVPSMSTPGEKNVPAGEMYGSFLDIDLNTYHEKRAGRLVLDPMCVRSLVLLPVYPFNYVCNSEARVEFGDGIASRLKLSPDGKTVLWPQPTDDPEDPQNVRPRLEGVAEHGNIDR